MTSKESKPVALDARELHSLLSTFGRYGPALALGIIVMLSVWALFIILHRTARGQRRKKNENAETESKQSETKARKLESRFTESTDNLKNNGGEVLVSEDINEEPGEDASLPREGKGPNLCDGVSDEQEQPDTEECRSVSEPHDHVISQSRSHEECTGDHNQDLNRHHVHLCDHPVLNDRTEYVSKEDVKGHWNDQNKHEADYPDHVEAYTSTHKEHAHDNHQCLGELASKPELHLGHHHQCINNHQEPLRNHCDCDVTTENTAESLCTNINNWQEVNTQKLCITEATMSNSDEYLNDYHEEASVTQHKQSDLSEGISDGSGSEDKIQDLDYSSSQLDKTCKVTEKEVIDTTLNKHQDTLNDHEHLSLQHEGLGSCHRGLSCHHERESDHLQHVSSTPEAADVTSETKTPDTTVNRLLEESSNRTEINIMEATMDNNEWMDASSVEIVKESSFPGVSLNHLGDGELEEKSLEKTADSSFAKSDIPKGSGTTASLDGDPMSKRVVAVQPIPQTVGVSFCVHYITHSPLQLLAVTGNQRELGSWENFVLLGRAKDGFWASSVTLPADCHVEWKFVLVENGKIHRWEECSNRHLQTGYEEAIHLHKWWGCV
ncbi:uncharacterized protein stbd1 [Megalops cyprinoides]|uniref:uncharacterized protein stbd1 n=1 Tax=Megalops cyprinoides TaxID=118141 RepID=UPI001864ABC5|nr:uncharacterized protein stbd1 [Megalops cyprinoides]